MQSALVVVAASSFAIRYGTEARMYSLLAILTVAAFLVLRRLLERPSLPAESSRSSGMVWVDQAWPP